MAGKGGAYVWLHDSHSMDGLDAEPSCWGDLSVKTQQKGGCRFNKWGERGTCRWLQRLHARLFGFAFSNLKRWYLASREGEACRETRDSGRSPLQLGHNLSTWRDSERLKSFCGFAGENEHEWRCKCYKWASRKRNGHASSNKNTIKNVNQITR